MADQLSVNQSSELYDVVREEVEDAFEHVALNRSCTLPMLLEETRARGLHDDDVRHVLMVDEIGAPEGVEAGMLFRCARSNAGVLYLTRDVAPVNTGASVFEGFVELWREAGECG